MCRVIEQRCCLSTVLTVVVGGGGGGGLIAISMYCSELRAG